MLKDLSRPSPEHEQLAVEEEGRDSGDTDRLRLSRHVLLATPGTPSELTLKLVSFPKEEARTAAAAKDLIVVASVLALVVGIPWGA